MKEPRHVYVLGRIMDGLSPETRASALLRPKDPRWRGFISWNMSIEVSTVAAREYSKRYPRSRQKPVRFLHMTLAGDSYNSIQGRLKAVISWPGEDNPFPDRWGRSMDVIKRGWLSLNGRPFSWRRGFMT